MNIDALLPATQALIAQLERLSGFPVSVVEDGSMPLLATIRTGTPSNPLHIIRVRPGDALPDYHVAYEVGFALRMFSRAPEARFNLAGNEAERRRVCEALLRKQPGLAPDQAEAVGRQLFDGLLRQLRSVPVGMLVDLTLHRDHPELRALQRQSLTAQAQENTTSLAAEHGRNFPEVVVQGNRAMNAAYALFVADLTDAPHLTVPFRAAGLESAGAQLLASVTAEPADQVDDRALIETWARQLGISDWLKFLPLT